MTAASRCKEKEMLKITEQNETKQLFALFYASCKNPTEAAVRAGIAPENAAAEGLRLLKLKSVRKLVKRFCECGLSTEEGVKIGLDRLAFGEINDVMEVVLSEEPVGLHKLFKMNFFNISEVKKVKGGGLEVKLFDRQRAMEKLLELYEKSENSRSAQDFINALGSPQPPEEVTESE